MTAHGQRSSAAHGKPDSLVADPADVAAARHEARFVREQRALRVSWANIAKMLRVEQSGLRDRYRGLAD